MAELVAGSQRSTPGSYVDQELLPDWSTSRRRALALLAHLEQFDESLAHEVLDTHVDVRDLLSAVPLVNETVGDEGLRWSVHPLWRSYLESELEADDVVVGLRRAGRALLARGEVGSGVKHLIEAEAWDDVADGIVQALGAANPPVARDVLAAWLERLPDDLRDSPHGQLLATIVAAFGGDGAQTWRNLERCAAAFRAGGNVRGELASLVQLGLHAWWIEDVEQLTRLANRVFQLEAEGCTEASPLACIGRALVWDIAGDSQRVLTELDRIPSGSLADLWRGIVAWIRSMALLQMGWAQEALEAAERAHILVGSFYPPVAGSRLQAVWYSERSSGDSISGDPTGEGHVALAEGAGPRPPGSGLRVVEIGVPSAVVWGSSAWVRRMTA